MVFKLLDLVSGTVIDYTTWLTSQIARSCDLSVVVILVNVVNNSCLIVNDWVVWYWRILTRIRWCYCWNTWGVARYIWYWFIWCYLCWIRWIGWVLWRWYVWNWFTSWINRNNLSILSVLNCYRVTVIFMSKGYTCNVVAIAITINIYYVVTFNHWCLNTHNRLTATPS